ILKEQTNKANPLEESYKELMECPKYFAFPTLAQKFFEHLNPNQKYIQGSFNEFFKLLQVEYGLKFEDHEKLELSKVIFRLHSPSRTVPVQQHAVSAMNEFVSLCYQLKDQRGEEALSFYFDTLRESDVYQLDEI